MNGILKKVENLTYSDVFERTVDSNIVELKPNEIFVFGSNLAGIHGAGAARIALEHFGAIKHQGLGLQGQSYALPTKDSKIQTLSLNRIKKFIISDFAYMVATNPSKDILVTAVGCGLAGYSPKDMAPLFADFIYTKNVHFSHEFWKVLYDIHMHQYELYLLNLNND